MRECNSNAKEVSKITIERDRKTNVKCYRHNGIEKERNFMSRFVKETMRILDANKKEKEYLNEKLGFRSNLIDIEARNLFRKVTVLMIKYAYRHNYYRLRCTLANNNMVEAVCLRCCRIETWEYAMKCFKIERNRADYVKKMIKEMIKKKLRDMKIDHIMLFIEGILRHLEGETEEDCETNQHYTRIQNLFQQCAVKAWFGMNFSNNQCRIINEFIAQLCIKHYDKYQKQRNKILHSNKKGREQTLKWY